MRLPGSCRTRAGLVAYDPSTRQSLSLAMACSTRARRLRSASPSAIADDAIASKDRSDQLWDSAVTAIGKHSLMITAQRLDLGGAVVHRVVAIPWTTAGNCDDS